MATKTRDVRLRFLVEDREANQKLGAIDQKMGKTTRAFGTAAGLIKGYMGIQAVGAVRDFATATLELGDRAETVQRRFDTVFGEMSGVMQQWVDDSNEKFGLAEIDLADYAAKVQDLLVPMGFARDSAADMTTEILETANALSEWAGVDVGQAIDAIVGAMLGERERLKTLGVKISEADLNALMASKGLDDLEGSARDTARAQGTLELIVGRSADALDAYQDRAETAAAKTKEFQARAADAENEVKLKLYPAIKDLRDEIYDLADNTLWLIDEIGKLGSAADTAGEDVAKSKSGWDWLINLVTKPPTNPFFFMELVNDGVNKLQERSENAKKPLEDLLTDIKDLEPFAKPAVDKVTDLAEATEDLGDASLDTEDDVAELTDEMERIKKKTDDAKEAYGQYIRKLNDAATPLSDAVDAVNDLESALEDARADGVIAGDELITIGEKAGGLEEKLVMLGKGDVELGLQRLATNIANYAGIPFDEAYDKLKEYVGELDLLDGREVNVTVQQRLATTGSAGGRIAVPTRIGSTPGSGGITEYQHGGVVPGPRGRPQWAVVHGGETILPTHQNGHTGNGAGITVPVTVELDGRVIAQVVAKHNALTARRN